MKTPLRLVLCLAVGLGLTACGGEKTPATPASDPGTGAEAPGASEAPSDATPSNATPSKGALISVLRELLAALEAGDTATAVGFFILPATMSQAKAREGVGSFVKKREISATGIDRLAADGTFGALGDVFPDRGAKWAQRAGIDNGTCYALALDGAEVGASWTGTTFKVFRLDDVGKLN